MTDFNIMRVTAADLVPKSLSKDGNLLPEETNLSVAQSKDCK